MSVFFFCYLLEDFELKIVFFSSRSQINDLIIFSNVILLKKGEYSAYVYLKFKLIFLREIIHSVYFGIVHCDLISSSQFTMYNINHVYNGGPQCT